MGCPLDTVLLEGQADADSVLSLTGRDGMKSPPELGTPQAPERTNWWERTNPGGSRQPGFIVNSSVASFRELS